MVKRLLSVFGFCVLAFGGSNQLAMAASPQETVTGLFMETCLGQLPDYEGMYDMLQSKGFEVVPYGPAETATEFEFGNADAKIWGSYQIGGECSIFSEDVAQGEMRGVAKRIVRKISGEAPEIWAWSDSDPSAWRAPYLGRVLYVSFGDNGLSIEMRDQ